MLDRLANRMIGVLMILVPIGWFVPDNWYSVLAGFLLWLFWSLMKVFLVSAIALSIAYVLIEFVYLVGSLIVYGRYKTPSKNKEVKEYKHRAEYDIRNW